MQKITFDTKVWIVYILLALMVGLMISSCRTARDNKAVARVLNNNTLTNKIGRVWEKSNPCVIDTIVQFKDGVEVVKYDTLRNDVINTVYDTATKVHTITEYKTIVKNINKTDTILIDKTDVRRLNLSLADNTKLQATNDQLKADNSAIQKKSSKKTWIIIALAGFIVLVGILKFYLK